jgi:predicted SAM-dependent methyltransferase
MIRRLNFGSGSIQPDGWHNVDIEDHGQQYIGSTELFEDNHFDMIVAHCSLQMVEYHEIVNVLKELRRILKPQGVLRFSLPNILTGFRAYEEDNIDWFPNNEVDIDTRFSSWLIWYSTTRSLYTPIAIMYKLMEAGFKENVPADYKRSHFLIDGITELDTRSGECFFIESRK